jgi:hypothetical protein
MEKISETRMLGNSIAHKNLFYNRLHVLAGPQIELNTIPLFYYSELEDIGRFMYLITSQPNILGGINDIQKTDALSLEAQKRKIDTSRLNRNFMSGFYNMLAFEHIISKNKVQSKFRLSKSPHLVTQSEIEEYRTKKEIISKLKAKDNEGSYLRHQTPTAIKDWLEESGYTNLTIEQVKRYITEAAGK